MTHEYFRISESSSYERTSRTIRLGGGIPFLLLIPFLRVDIIKGVGASKIISGLDPPTSGISGSHKVHVLFVERTRVRPRAERRGEKGQTQNMSKALATKNVAAVLLAVALVFGFAFSFAAPVKAQSISDLQAQIQALLAQIQALQGGSSSGGACVSFTFTTNFRQGQSGAEVMQIQKFLNTMADTRVAATGAGSPGNETSFFGPATAAAVRKFQEKYAADILTPVGLTAGNGYWGPSTRAKANALAAACVPGTTPGTTPGGTVGGTLQVMAGSQPANSLAVQGASRVPFTTFTLTNTSAAAVTINNVTVQKNGLGDKAVFDGIILVDATGQALGNSKTMNSNNQAVLDAGITLQPGQSAQLTVAGNMLTSGLNTYAGQIIGLSVVGVNTNGTVSGSLPISGAMHTINATLSIGSMTAAVGSEDPNTTALNSSTTGKPIGTTGFTFGAIRLTNTGSAEDQWVKSIRWNQSGSASASDLANVVTVVDGTSYPMTISADGKYYTVVFPGNGLEVQKGLQKEFTVKADIVNGPARTISFDLYKATDIYVVGETFGYGITPTASATAAIDDASQFTTGTPFFSGTVVQVNAGTVSSVSRANEVAAQNIVELSPNQPLGGFAVDIKGEPITVASLTFGFDISGTEDATDLDNITLVDANGVVVAGPVDGTTGTGTDGKVTFTDTVTFPTGRMVYTLKGQLSSSFANGDTIVATTTPSDYWTNVRGTITGNTITLTNSAVSANTMTVRAGSVVLSIAGTPAAQTIVAGATGQTVSAINFDATQSGEDVRFNAAKFRFTESLTTTDDLNNCAAYDGATRLNSSSVTLDTDATDFNFSFDTPLLVAKGTVKNVAIKCDIPSSITGGTFSVGFTSAVTFTGTGVTSSQTITPTSSTAATQAGNTMTVASGGALTVALDSSSPSATLAAAGTSGVTLTALRFNGTNEDMKLDRIALQMSNGAASSSPDNLTQVTIWDGATQVGTATFAGTRFATSTLSGNVIIPANGFKVLTVKGDLAGIGTGQATTTNGLVIEVDYDGSDSTGTRAVGQQSGTTINTSSTTDTDTSPVRVYRSYPTFAVIDVPTTNLVSGENIIYRFSITASNTGFGVGIDEITANIATSSISALSDMELYAYTDSGFSSPVSGFTGGLLAEINSGGNVTTGNKSFDLGTSELQIPAGGTRYFEIRIDATLSGSGTEQISTKIMGDTGSSVGPTLTVAASTAVSAANFVWSGNATTTSESTHLDWTNGYAVPGLPAGGSSTKTLQKTN